MIENPEGARNHAIHRRLPGRRRGAGGRPAKRQAVTNPKNTLYAVKRPIGRKFSEKEVQKDIHLMPPQDRGGRQRRRWVEVRGKQIPRSRSAR